MDAHYGTINDPDLPPVVHPPPAPTLSTSSSLLNALAQAPTLQHRRTQNERSSPPPFYNPYPYGPQWRLFRVAMPDEVEFWRHRQDIWHQDAYGLPLYQVYGRVFGLVTAGIAKRQREAKKQFEDARLKAEPPPEPGTVDDGTCVEFVAADGRRGLPAKLLLSTRRAVERGMHSPKLKCLAGWPKDTIWVRVKWPAYPEYELRRSIYATIRAGSKRPRRLTTRLELVVALSALLTQYYSDVSELEPAPEFAHLALGAKEGRLSIYALRMLGIRLAPDGIFDMLLELEDVGQDHPSRSTALVQPVFTADVQNLVSFDTRDQMPFHPQFVEGSSSAYSLPEDRQPEPYYLQA
ncbi:hypothetical protein PYCCODRAFT_1459264 [Trametes coccinea BRFM310]|uniref:Uncharacterized protein n=1 Tax=Trametes coccinea (strain BRFM310) TaxID=1353009 RepID=A0A1Y2ILM6_TRAC3|nr:hypothetical protein PYCCODRAFT_1459264 [Trametes coccinea BRFM310]